MVNFFRARWRAGEKRIVSVTSDWQIARALEIKGHLERQVTSALEPGQKINIIAQSAEALPVMTILDMLCNDPQSPGQTSLAGRIGNVIFSSPAGLIEERTRFQRLGSISSQVVGSVARLIDKRRVGQSITDPNDQLIRNDDSFFKLLAILSHSTDRHMAAAAAVSYQGHLMSRVGRTLFNPGIGLVVGAYDTLIPVTEVFMSLQPSDYDGILVTNNGHGIGTRTILKQVLQLFDTLDELSASPSRSNSLKPTKDKVDMSDISPKVRSELTKIIDRRDISLTA